MKRLEQTKYSELTSLIVNSLQKEPSDADAFRLLGEVKYELQDYEGSAVAYKSSAMVRTVKFVCFSLDKSILSN